MLKLLKAASLSEVELAGFKFRVKRIVSFDLLPHDSPILAVLPRSPEDLEELRAIADTTDPQEKTARSLDMARRIAERESDPERQRQRWERDLALAKAGLVEAWDEEAAAWVKVRLVDTEEEAELAPDALWTGHIPGGQAGIRKLAEAVLSASTSLGGDAARIERFRGGS